MRKGNKVNILILILILLCVLSSCQKEIIECEALAPFESPKMLSTERDSLNINYPELDFTEKETIGLGKYGFRYTLQIEKPVVLYQKVSEDLQLEDVTYGIYEDEGLEKPVSEICIKDIIDTQREIELGEATYESFPGYRESNQVALDPGKYYLAVYSTNYREKSIVSYECLYGEVKTELDLKENEWEFFFSAGKEQDTYFEIEVEEPGTLLLNRELWMDYEVWLCNDQKKLIKEAKVPLKHTNNEFCTAKVCIEEPGKYFLKVNISDENTVAWCYEIKYKME